MLFTGTGCQVNGLKKFLGKDYDNLICMDVICHGAPSPALWREKELTSATRMKVGLISA